MNKARWVSATAGAAMIAATLVLRAAGVAYASGNGNVTGNGNVGLLSGNTITAPISVPVNLCGVSLGIIGFGNSGCEGGASSNVSTQPDGGGGNGGSSGNGNVIGNGNIGVGSGNTVTAPISAPVNVCAVSGSVGGYTNSDCRGGAHSNVDLANGGGNGGSNGNVTGIGGTPNGTGPGTTTTVTNATGPVSSGLPTTGADLLLLGVAAIGTIGVGAGAVTLTRRRRSSSAS